MKRRSLLASSLPAVLAGCTTGAPTVTIAELRVENSHQDPHSIAVSVSSSDEIAFHEMVDIDGARNVNGTIHAESRTLDIPELRGEFFRVTAIGPQARRWDTSEASTDVTFRVIVQIDRDARVRIMFSGRSSE